MALSQTLAVQPRPKLRKRIVGYTADRTRLPFYIGMSAETRQPTYLLLPNDRSFLASILISGPSGAGKSITTRILIENFYIEWKIFGHHWRHPIIVIDSKTNYLGLDKPNTKARDRYLLRTIHPKWNKKLRIPKELINVYLPAYTCPTDKKSALKTFSEKWQAKGFWGVPWRHITDLAHLGTVLKVPSESLWAEDLRPTFDKATADPNMTLKGLIGVGGVLHQAAKRIRNASSRSAALSFVERWRHNRYWFSDHDVLAEHLSDPFSVNVLTFVETPEKIYFNQLALLIALESLMATLQESKEECQPCVTGDTKVLLKSGVWLPIKEIVENRMIGEEVFAFDENKMAITFAKILAVQKHKKYSKLIRITTSTNKQIEVTPEHEIPILENGNVKWKRADNIHEGDYLITPSTLPAKNETFEQKLRCEFKEKLPHLIYVHGLVFADGWWGHSKRTSVIKLVNTCPQLLTEFEEVMKSLNCHVGKDASNVTFPKHGWNDGWKNVPTLRVYNKKLTETFTEIEKNLLGLSKPLLAKWLSGYTDGDGSIFFMKNGKPQLSYGCANRFEAEVIQSVLLKFGVNSRLQPNYSSKIAWNVTIPDSSNVVKLCRILSFKHPKKEERRKIAAKLRVKNLSKREVVPCGSLLRMVRRTLHMPMFILSPSYASNVCRFETNKHPMRRAHLQKCVRRIQKYLAENNNTLDIKCSICGQPLQRVSWSHLHYKHKMTPTEYRTLFPLSPIVGEALRAKTPAYFGLNTSPCTQHDGGRNLLEQITKLAKAPFIFEKVTNVEETENDEEYVYDISTTAGNFLANNIFVSNCIVIHDVLNFIGEGKPFRNEILDALKRLLAGQARTLAHGYIVIIETQSLDLPKEISDPTKYTVHLKLEWKSQSPALRRVSGFVGGCLAIHDHFNNFHRPSVVVRPPLTSYTV